MLQKCPQGLIYKIRFSFYLTQTRIRHYFQHLLIRKNNNIAILKTTITTLIAVKNYE